MLSSIVWTSRRIQSHKFVLTQPDQLCPETLRNQLPLKNGGGWLNGLTQRASLTCLTGIVRGTGAGCISCVKLMS